MSTSCATVTRPLVQADPCATTNDEWVENRNKDALDVYFSSPEANEWAVVTKKNCRIGIRDRSDWVEIDTKRIVNCNWDCNGLQLAHV